MTQFRQRDVSSSRLSALIELRAWEGESKACACICVRERERGTKRRRELWLSRLFRHREKVTNVLGKYECDELRATLANTLPHSRCCLLSIISDVIAFLKIDNWRLVSSRMILVWGQTLRMFSFSLD